MSYTLQLWDKPADWPWPTTKAEADAQFERALGDAFAGVQPSAERLYASGDYAGMRPDGSKALRCEEVPVGSNFFGQSSFATHALTYERTEQDLRESHQQLRLMADFDLLTLVPHRRHFQELATQALSLSTPGSATSRPNSGRNEHSV